MPGTGENDEGPTERHLKDNDTGRDYERGNKDRLGSPNVEPMQMNRNGVNAIELDDNSAPKIRTAINDEDE